MMFVNEAEAVEAMRTRISTADSAMLDSISSEVIRAYAGISPFISEDAGALLEGLVGDRRKALAARAATCGQVVSRFSPMRAPAKPPRILNSAKQVRDRNRRAARSYLSQVAAIPAKLVRHPRFTPAVKSVIARICHIVRNSPHGVCDVTVKYLARGAHVCERAAQKAIRVLSEYRLIGIQSRSGSTNVIRILNPEWAARLNGSVRKSASLENDFSLSFLGLDDSSMGERPCTPVSSKLQVEELVEEAVETVEASAPANAACARSKRPNFPPLNVTGLAPNRLRAWMDDLMIQTSRFGGYEPTRSQSSA